jgi:heat shock protein HtpX
LAIFRPETAIRTVDESSATRIFILSLSLNGGFANASPIPPLFDRLQNIPIMLPSTQIIPVFLYRQIEVPSVTGMLCLMGLAMAVCYFVLAIALNDKIVARVFQIIPLTREEYPSLRKKVDEISRKLVISPPKIGLTEDLRPNAFISGYGRKAMLVYSVGILNALDEEELAAVAAHELTHIKKHDFFFKALSTTLTIFSFFNPFAYFAASAAQREREMFADEQGAKLLEQPNALVTALAKTYKAMQAFPKQGLLVRLTSSLFLVSPIAQRPEILATHPRVNQRINNIAGVTEKTTTHRRNVAVTVFLSLLIILGGLMATYPIVKIQTSFTQDQPRLISIRIPVEGPKFGFVPCLERTKVQTNELGSPFGFALRPAKEFINAEKKPVVMMLILNDSNATGLGKRINGLIVFGAVEESEEPYPRRSIEQGALKSSAVDESGTRIVRVLRAGPSQAKATLDYSVNTELQASSLWSNRESYETQIFQPQKSSPPNLLCFNGFMGDTTERTKSMIESVNNESVIFGDTMLLVFCPPSTCFATLQEPINFYILFSDFDRL